MTEEITPHPHTANLVAGDIFEVGWEEWGKYVIPMPDVVDAMCREYGIPKRVFMPPPDPDPSPCAICGRPTDVQGARRCGRCHQEMCRIRDGCNWSVSEPVMQIQDSIVVDAPGYELLFNDAVRVAYEERKTYIVPYDFLRVVLGMDAPSLEEKKEETWRDRPPML